jgi:hypothetical protein
VTRKTKGETELQRAIKKALEALGVWVIRTQTSGRTGPRSIATGEPGMPDLYAVGLGWLEVKTETGKLSEDQRAWHARAQALGVRVAVVRSVKEAVEVVLSWRGEAAA